MKCFKRQFFVVLIFAAVVSENSAQAFEFVTTRGSGIGKTLIISEPSATTLLLLPSSGINQNECIVELGGMREFELSELDRAYVAAAARYKNYTVAFGLSQLGQRDFYSERTGKLSIAYQWQNCNFSANISGIEYYFGGGYDSQSAGAAGIGFSYHYRRLFLGMAADNLNSPKLFESSPAINPQYSFYGEFVGKKSFSVTARVSFEKNQSAQMALGQKIDVSNRSDLFWGMSTKPFQLGGGFDIWYSERGAITYSGSYHPVLGLSHNLSIVYHFGKARKSTDRFE